MFRVLKDHCGLLRWENTSKYMYKGHFEFTARQVCLFLLIRFFPYLSSSLADCPASKQRTALNKHLEPCGDSLESINSPKWDKVDKKRINL